MENNNLQDFKSEAWKSQQMAAKYAQNVNRGSGWANYNHAAYLKQVLRNINISDKILDVGAGTGALTIPLSELGYDVDALDISTEMMSYISAAVPKVRLIEADLTNLENLNDKYDVVISRWVLPHFSNYPTILGEIKKVLKPNGKIVFDMPNGSQFQLVSNSRAYEILDKNLFGYDHQAGAVNDNFYACATSEQLRSVASTLNMTMSKRIYFNFFSTNLLLAILLGNRNYGRLKRLLEKIFMSGRAPIWIFKNIDSFISFISPKIFFHSTIVIFRRNR
jgi:2-polyprenyl-3-methyl-5-hydroxy-6-metoxy-1,4-benzoquinol methylase